MGRAEPAFALLLSARLGQSAVQWLKMGDEGSADPVEGEPWGRGFRSLPDPMKGAEGKPVIHKPQDKYSRR